MFTLSHDTWGGGGLLAGAVLQRVGSLSGTVINILPASLISFLLHDTENHKSKIRYSLAYPVIYGFKSSNLRNKTCLQASWAHRVLPRNRQVPVESFSSLSAHSSPQSSKNTPTRRVNTISNSSSEDKRRRSSGKEQKRIKKWILWWACSHLSRTLHV